MTRNLHETVVLARSLNDNLIGVCVEALPDKAYGLLGGSDPYHPRSLYPCSTNLRNNPEWKPLFESYGDFYTKDAGRGFVISLEEQRDILREMETRDESFIGIYHSHRFTAPGPSQLDLDLHIAPHLFCYIVSVVTPESPELKIYRLEKPRCEEIPFRVE